LNSPNESETFTLNVLGLARTSVLNRRVFFAASMKRVLNGSERTAGRFIAAFFQTQHASFFWAVRWPLSGWRVAMQLERTYLLARTSDKITARLPGTGALITVFGR
jgi:hypothetical protein